MHIFCIGIALATFKYHMSNQMNKYHQYLKCKYELLELVSIDEQLDCLSSKYITLTLLKVDEKGKTTSTECRKGDSVTLSEALNVQREKRKVILIKGDPGMGKSTLAINICKCWAEGSLLQDYNAVILLPLRDPEIQAAKSIADILLMPDESLRAEIATEIISQFGENICFILEGYDELPQQLLTNNFTLFAKLKEKLPKCMLVYTSRPEGCSRIEDSASRIIEIEGFEIASVDEYISSSFQSVSNGKELAAKLKLQLQRHPIMKETLHVPINVAIVCLIFYHFSTLPETLTQLYTLLCLHLILRHIITRTANVGQVNMLRSLDNLPPDVSEQYSQLCSLAFKGIKNEKIIFSSKELVDFGISEQKMSTLGLLMTAPRPSVYGIEKSYNFLHKTIQEFCSAWYISKLSLQNQLKFVKDYWLQDNYTMVWRFYSGITGLSDKEIVNCMLPYKMVNSLLTTQGKRNLLNCVFEAQNNEVCQKVGSYFDGDVNISTSTTAAISYFFAQYKGKMKTIWFNMSDDVITQLLTEALLTRKLQHSSIQLINTDALCWITRQASLCLIKLLEHCPVAKFHSNNITILANSTLYLSKKSWSSHMKFLSEVFTVKFLSQIFIINNSLCVLNISKTSIGPDGAAYFADLRNIQLHTIDLSLCNLGPSGADKIGEMLRHNKSIVSVNLYRNSIGDKGTEKIVQHLKSHNNLQQLYLGKNNITYIGACSLRGLIECDSTTLTTIELSENPLRDDGICVVLSSLTIVMDHIGMISEFLSTSSQDAVAAALHKTRSFRIIPPSDCALISQSIATSMVLKHLELDRVSEKANNTILSGIMQNSSIVSLKISYSTNNWMAGVIKLLETNKTLKELSISTWGQQPQDLIVISDCLIQSSCIETFEYRCHKLHHSQQSPLPSVILEFLLQLKQACTITTLKFLLPYQIEKEYQFLTDVERNVQQTNNIRSTNGKSSLKVNIGEYI